MSTTTRTGGDTPIVISMEPATTVVSTVEVTPSRKTEENTSPARTSQPSEVIESTTDSAVPTSSDVPSPNPTPSLTVADQTTAATDTGNEDKTSVSWSTTESLIPPSTLQTTLVPSPPDATPTSTALPSLTTQPKPGLSIPASIGLGVSMGVIAFLVILGVGYAVFGRYLGNLRRDSDRGIGVTQGRR